MWFCMDQYIDNPVSIKTQIRVKLVLFLYVLLYFYTKYKIM